METVCLQVGLHVRTNLIMYNFFIHAAQLNKYFNRNGQKSAINNCLTGYVLLFARQMTVEIRATSLILKITP